MRRSLSQVLLPPVRGTGLLDGLIPRARAASLFLTAFIFTVVRAVASAWGMSLLDVAAINVALFLIGLRPARVAFFAGYTVPRLWSVAGR